MGDVFLLPEEDYLYGVGPIIAKITEVRERVDYRGETWWFVFGDVANGDPTNHGGFVARHLYIRAASIRRTRQVPRI